MCPDGNWQCYRFQISPLSVHVELSFAVCSLLGCLLFSLYFRITWVLGRDGVVSRPNIYSIKGKRIMVRTITRSIFFVCLVMPLFTLHAGADSAKTKRGLNTAAQSELSAAGVDKYLGEFTPTSGEDVGGGWTRHTFDTEGGDGPICIEGDPYSVLTKAGDPKKLLIFLQGGGACWQGFYNCSRTANDGARPPFGVFDATEAGNPFADYSIVYLPYCDGSAFGGDNDVSDAEFSGGTRYHRGVRNQSAGMDVAGDMFPRAKQVTVMGHSAGGVGVAAFAPFLTRYVFGNNIKLTVFNDAGPIAVNLGTGKPPGNGAPFFGCADTACFSLVARAFDWQFAKFYPQSCIDDGRCDAFGQQTGIIDWRLENDATIREAFYETDSDGTNRFFAQGDGTLMDPEVYRELILTEHGAIHDKYPRRYKRFIVSADDTHGGVQGTASSNCFPYPQPFLFYTQEANGELLNEWTREFVRIGSRQSQFGWQDIVEDYTPVDC